MTVNPPTPDHITHIQIYHATQIDDRRTLRASPGSTPRSPRSSTTSGCVRESFGYMNRYVCICVLMVWVGGEVDVCGPSDPRSSTRPHAYLINTISLTHETIQNNRASWRPPRRSSRSSRPASPRHVLTHVYAYVYERARVCVSSAHTATSTNNSI